MNSKRSKARVAVFHQDLMANPGGAAAVCVWTIQALSEICDLTFISYGSPLDLSALNSFYGTSLQPSKFQISYLRSPLLLNSLKQTTLRSLRLALAARQLVKFAEKYDLFVSTVGEVALPTPSVQYINYPFRNSQSLKMIYSGPGLLFQLLNNAVFHIVSPRSDEPVLMLTNSQFIHGVIKKVYRQEAEVLEPPVFLPDRDRLPWEERENGFVVLGRMAPEKKIHRAIGLIDSLHATGADVRLHLAGTGARRYYAEIEALANERPYVFLHPSLSRDELAALLGRCRYGLHTTIGEHYGLAVAEMILAGCIPFVHNSGGQVEVLGELDALIYIDDEDAQRKILRVLGDSELQSRLRERLGESAMSRINTPQKFMVRIGEVVARALEEFSVS